jgi:coiled-coil domain-containing protein 61
MEDQSETPFSLRGTSHRLHIAICQVTTFAISLLDDDQMERWMGEFSAPFIEDLTRKAGSARSASVFWKMLQHAIAGTSSDITFEILSGQDVARMRSESSSRLNANSDSMYLVVCYVTSFDQVRYPLLLHRKPYSLDEWRAIVRSLKSDNRKLQSQVAASSQTDVVHSLEAQVYELNVRVKQVHEEKDRVINELKQRIANFDRPHVRPKKGPAREARKAADPVPKPSAAG